MNGTVKLIVTGKMEEKALATALTREFSGLSFSTKRLDGMTSVDFKVPPVSKPSVPQNVDKLASELVAAVDPGRKGTPEDMAIVIDDLEVANLQQPKVVIKYFREAVTRCVLNRWPSQNRQQSCLEKVRESCSFHLFVPMTEAYFFGEVPDALNRAGVKLPSMVSSATMDVEDFLVTDDAGYLWARAQKIPGIKDDVPYWAPPLSNLTEQKAAERLKNWYKRHPKHYLEYLYDRKGINKKKTGYQETDGGVKALESLDWNSVLSGNPNHVKYLRSLFDDISCRFGLPNPYSGECAFITDCKQGSVLRNI